METVKIKYCVEYTLKSPSTEWYDQQQFKFYETAYEAGEFLVRIKHNIGFEAYASHPKLFFCGFEEVNSSVTKKVISKYRMEKGCKDHEDKKDYFSALNKLTEREKKLLGIK